jgi:DNA-binding transcriptional LysR family regulator
MQKGNLRGFDLNLLTVFEALYEERSQVKVAERLGMTQSTVSHAIGRMESIVKEPLFLRRGRGVEPTNKAHDLYPTIHQALNLVRGELLQSGQFNPATSRRTFVVALTYGAGLVFCPLLYARFKAAAPEARLVIRTVDPEEDIPRLLREHRIDVAIHHRRFNDPMLEQPMFWEDQLVLIARAGHSRIQRPPSQEQLLAERFVQAYHLFDEIADQETDTLLEIIRQRTVMEVPNTLLLAAVAATSDLLAVVISGIAPYFDHHFGIRSYPLPQPLPSLRCCLAWHRSVAKDPENHWLRTLLLETAEHLKQQKVRNDPARLTRSSKSVDAEQAVTK